MAFSHSSSTWDRRSKRPLTFERKGTEETKRTKGFTNSLVPFVLCVPLTLVLSTCVCRSYGPRSVPTTIDLGCLPQSLLKLRKSFFLAKQPSATR